ncbi:hypothetical protein SDC9_193472 [bioreactor metagenome]|uniref:Uncharacterized protein n=1 Tax=bioreactor metagenome TaxID=1076179 RepID=A0A645IEU2_9ZZZZ
MTALCLKVNKLNVIRYIFNIGYTALIHIGMDLYIIIVLAKCKPDAVRNSSICLSVNSCNISNNSNVIYTSVFDHCSFPSSSIYFYFCHKKGVGISRRWIADTCIRVEIFKAVDHRIFISCFIFRFNPFGNHFIISPVASVRFAHSVHKLIGS